MFGQNKLKIPPKLKDALKAFSRTSSEKFLFIDDDLLLEAAPKSTMEKTLDKSDVIAWILKFELDFLIKSFDKITKLCNEKIENLKRIKIKPKGFYIPENSDIPKALVEDIKNGSIELSKLSGDLFDKIILKSITSEDYIKPEKGNDLHWLNFMVPDGKVFPYTILPDNILSKYGFPTGLYTKGDEDFNPQSIKNIYYIDPKTLKVTRGIYFEVYEGPGPEGKGGINGIIVEEGKPLIIINTKKNGSP